MFSLFPLSPIVLLPLVQLFRLLNDLLNLDYGYEMNIAKMLSNLPSADATQSTISFGPQKLRFLHSSEKKNIEAYVL